VEAISRDLEALVRLRKRLGLSQRELARISGVSQSLISKIERGKINPSYEAVRRRGSLRGSRA